MINETNRNTLSKLVMRYFPSYNTEELSASLAHYNYARWSALLRNSELVRPWRGNGVSASRAAPRTRWTPAAADSADGQQTVTKNETSLIYTSLKVHSNCFIACSLHTNEVLVILRRYLFGIFFPQKYIWNTEMEIYEY